MAKAFPRPSHASIVPKITSPGLRMLLRTAVYWLFDTFSVPQIALNVDDGNELFPPAKI